MNTSQPGQPDWTGQVVTVCRSAGHEFSKAPQPGVRLIAGLGVDGDAHSGVKVQHRSRVAADPEQSNLRQVHLLHAELFDELADKGFDIQAGQLGENITTRGLELLALPTGTRLSIGSAVIELTGLRNPCSQIENFKPGLLGAVLEHDETGRLIRKAGVMGVVLESGDVKPGDAVEVTLPPEPWLRLERV